MNYGEELVQPFDLESYTFYAKKMLQQPINLDTMNYNYYIKLLQVQFSNVVPNVKDNLYVKDGANPAVLVVGKGIYDITDLTAAYNALGLGKLEYMSTNGKCKLTNDTGNTLSLTSTFLTNEVIGFDDTQITSIANGAEVVANHAVVIQDYNYFILTSDNIVGNTLTAKAGNNTFEITNTLWTFSSALKPLQFKTWTAIMPILFPVETQSFQYITFELRDGNGNVLNDLIAQSDFHVNCQLIRTKKL